MKTDLQNTIHGTQEQIARLCDELAKNPSGKQDTEDERKDLDALTTVAEQLLPLLYRRRGLRLAE